MSDWMNLDQEYIVGCYGRFPAVLVKGRGAKVWDETGKEYLDLGSGIGVNSLGYCDPEWVEAVSGQAARLQHTSNLYYTTPDIALAQKLCTETGYQKAFFCNSGAEANEALLKIARKYSFDKYGKGRHTIITLVNSFHGRTMNTLTATGQDVFHNFFFPFAEGFRYAQPTWEGVQEQLDDSVCGILIEPIQGEGGVCPLDKEFVQKLAKLCEEKDILLLCDEVQTGIGRTGKLLAAEWFDVRPDVVSLAKGLGGGLPIGAVLCNEKTQNVLGPSHHGTTFGGNPVGLRRGAGVLGPHCRPCLFAAGAAEGRADSRCPEPIPGGGGHCRAGYDAGHPAENQNRQGSGQRRFGSGGAGAHRQRKGTPAAPSHHHPGRTHPGTGQAAGCSQRINTL